MTCVAWKYNYNYSIIIIAHFCTIYPEKGVRFMDWTQKELEELYQKINQRALEDAEFRKELMADAHTAIEKVAGRKLPEGFRLETIETDLSYNRTFVAPDFAPGELDLQNLKTDAESLPKVGASFALIVSFCAAAVAVGPCPLDGCGANVCGGAVCGGAICAGDVCGGAVCAGAVCGGEGCGGVGCGTAGCGGDGAAGAVCGGDACGAEGCAGAVCGGNVCGAEGCKAATCGGYTSGNK